MGIERLATVIDLGGPEGGRYWRVVSDHPADHPDARAAAIYARATGSVGCTYNDATVERAPSPVAASRFDPLADLRTECGYSPDGEDEGVDALLAYKDALEERCRSLEAGQR